MRRTASVVLAALIPALATASPQDGFRIDLDYGEIEKIRVDPQGSKILIGGTFNLGGLPGDRMISRHHPNGERDTDFNTTSFTPPNGRIFSFARLPGGQILIGGDFSGASYPANLALLRGDGVWESSFNLGVNGAVRMIETFLPSGQEPEIYLGGAFNQVDGEDRTGIARLTDGGRIDQDFIPPVLAAGGTVRAIARQPDGRILIGGSNLRLRDIDKASLALYRLNPDGSHDDSFLFASELGVDGSDTVHAITIQNDGKILVGGDFTIGTGGTVRSHLARLNSDGSIDASLDAGLGAPVTDVALQADGRPSSPASSTTRNSPTANSPASTSTAPAKTTSAACSNPTTPRSRSPSRATAASSSPGNSPPSDPAGQTRMTCPAPSDCYPAPRAFTTTCSTSAWTAISTSPVPSTPKGFLCLEEGRSANRMAPCCSEATSPTSASPAASSAPRFRTARPSPASMRTCRGTRSLAESACGVSPPQSPAVRALP